MPENQPLIEQQLPRELFKELFEKELDEFSGHVARVRRQYSELRKLKQHLPSHEMIVQMDFAENFSCRSLDEVQTAYWNQTSVKLHPVVVYFKENDTLAHKSFVVVSDEASHSASTVCAFTDSLMPRLKEIDPDVRVLHYWTDSPSSQYRNRFIFCTVANHKSLYGMEARWNYFESGHGKGPCDGLGGTTKRMADEAIRQGNAVIQDPKEFYSWAVTSTMKGVTFQFVPKAACKNKKEVFIKAKGIPRVRNTMKLHAVSGTGEAGMLKTRETSCYCELCISGKDCGSWTSALANIGYTWTFV